jgi:hypothetical protein
MSREVVCIAPDTLPPDFPFSEPSTAETIGVISAMGGAMFAAEAVTNGVEDFVENEILDAVIAFTLGTVITGGAIGTAVLTFKGAKYTYQGLQWLIEQKIAKEKAEVYKAVDSETIETITELKKELSPEEIKSFNEKLRAAVEKMLDEVKKRGREPALPASPEPNPA